MFMADAQGEVASSGRTMFDPSPSRRWPYTCAQLVYTKDMKNITLSADEELIEDARRRAKAENTTLNNLFGEWLARYAAPKRLSHEDVRSAVAAAGHFRAGRRFTRDERNEQ